MAFDVQGARNAGYSEDEIAQYLESKSDKTIPKFDIPTGKFDVQGALNAGYTEKDIAEYAVSKGWGADDKKPVAPAIQTKTAPSFTDTAIDVLKGVKENIVGKGEAVLSTVSNLAAMPVAGLAGLGVGLVKGDEAGADTVEKVSRALTYKPVTQRGEQETAIVNKPLELLDTAGTTAGEYASKITNSPMIGAGTKTALMMIIPGIVGKGAKVTLKSVLKEAPKEARPSLMTDIINAAKEAETTPDAVVKTFVDDIKAESLESGLTTDQVVQNKARELLNKGKEEPVQTNGGTTTAEAPTGEMGVTQLAKNVEAAALEKRLTDKEFGNLTEYEKMSMTDQANMAISIMDKDWEQAKRMAMGKEQLPSGMRPTTIFEAVADRAEKMGDLDTMVRLATESPLAKAASEAGQIVKAADYGREGNAFDAIREVAEVRTETAKRTGQMAKKDFLEKVLDKTTEALDSHLSSKEPPERAYGKKNIVVNEESTRHPLPH